jgi:hypothetical protein
MCPHLLYFCPYFCHYSVRISATILSKFLRLFCPNFYHYCVQYFAVSSICRPPVQFYAILLASRGLIFYAKFFCRPDAYVVSFLIYHYSVSFFLPNISPSVCPIILLSSCPVLRHPLVQYFSVMSNICRIVISN